jgi:hypothetical protein
MGIMLRGCIAGRRAVGNLFMVSDHFSDDEIQQLLGEGRIQL